ncbi:MAG: phosphatidate cytidylyltransferase [Verrucomicrobia bacterium]|nr:phosphatidate cytidylyltransferase [Verrucomicrobiota bacterium]
MTAQERLFEYRHAFDHPVTIWTTVAVAALLVVAPMTVCLLGRLGKLTPPLHEDLVRRIRSWFWLAPIMIVPVLLGAAWTILAVGLLSLACYREYARATGLFREKAISFVVVLGILGVTFATLDHWSGLFVAWFPLTVATIAATAILADRPKGYIQRVALGVLGFMFFGCALGHLGYFANDQNYRPILLMLLLAVEMNDVFAYVTGKTVGRRKLAPNTSPNKTVAGSIGALVLTALLVLGVGRSVFAGTPLEKSVLLALLGIIISVVGQLGDLTLSSIKRDLGLKDISTLIPGHGGLLDRFNSLLFVAPAAFHYIGYFVGIGLDQPARILSGG